MTATLRVIGLGGQASGDDAAGRLVVEQLSSAKVPLDLICTSSPLDLVDLLVCSIPVVLVDAVIDLDRAPGTLVELTAEALASETIPLSSHGFDVEKALAVARAIHRQEVQTDVKILAIVVDPQRCGPSMGVSSKVDRATKEAALRIAGWASALRDRS